MMSPCEVQDFAEMLRPVGGYSSFSVVPYVGQDITLGARNVVFIGDFFVQRSDVSIYRYDINIYRPDWLGGHNLYFGFWNVPFIHLPDVYFRYVDPTLTVTGYNFYGYVITYY